MARKTRAATAGRSRDRKRITATATAPARRSADGRAAKMDRIERSLPASTWKLRLYIAGQSPRSIAALANLKRLCNERLPNRHHIEVVDLQQHPHLAADDGILAIPTLVRRLPPPMRKIIGDLSDRDRAMLNLNLL